MSRPTMETVAERAGVSRALVSLVMNNSSKVSEAKRQAVLRAAEQLGYRPNLHARNLAQARTKTLGMIINDIHNPFFAEIVDGVQAGANEQGYRVLIASGHRAAAGEEAAIDAFLEFRPEALILAGVRLSTDFLDELGQEVERNGLREGKPEWDVGTEDGAGRHRRVPRNPEGDSCPEIVSVASPAG